MARRIVEETTSAVSVETMMSGRMAAAVTGVTRPTALTQTAQGDGEA